MIIDEGLNSGPIVKRKMVPVVCEVTIEVIGKGVMRPFIVQWEIRA